MRQVNKGVSYSCSVQLHGCTLRVAKELAAGVWIGLASTGREEEAEEWDIGEWLPTKTVESALSEESGQGQEGVK